MIELATITALSALTAVDGCHLSWMVLNQDNLIAAHPGRCFVGSVWVVADVTSKHFVHDLSEADVGV
jgi:hypothetical protein